MRPRYIILNVMLGALIAVYWHLGAFEAIPALGDVEIGFVVTLSAYGLLGMIAAWRGQWDKCSHYANGAPKLGLVFTSCGLILAAVSFVAGTDPLSMLKAFVFALTPNMLAAFILWWLSELAWHAAKERV